VLLIGNSQIRYLYDAGEMLEKLAASTSPTVDLEAVESIRWSSSLKTNWDDGRAIPTGPFDFVVIQDTLGFSRINKNIAAEFMDYGSRIDKWAKEQGGRTVFWMEQTYTPPSPDELSIADRERINSDLARKLHADVAPIGLAWERAWQERPDLLLYAQDGAHPNVAGTYLMACVLYATILKKSPVGLKYQAQGVSPFGLAELRSTDASYLQHVAWRTCLAYEFAHVGMQE